MKAGPIKPSLHSKISMPYPDYLVRSMSMYCLFEEVRYLTQDQGILPTLGNACFEITLVFQLVIVPHLLLY